MRSKISNLIEENNHLKDQIYNITTQLYHFENENQSLKAEVVRVRDKEKFPISYLNDQMQKSVNQGQGHTPQRYTNNESVIP